ncbi:hypothetical protein ES288_A11G078900v1 [Gossypium darwinii]|uniref:Uncharacterized protein n=1 Tax=Gossypium darwinii TaxID=34276 RepID=A0A5D2EHS6_GOSDA|nr:hypothetical protein ES288_A11G078900v1 [Gossypium darwinii]
MRAPASSLTVARRRAAAPPRRPPWPATARDGQSFKKTNGGGAEAVVDGTGASGLNG